MVPDLGNDERRMTKDEEKIKWQSLEGGWGAEMTHPNGARTPSSASLFMTD